jgi:pimeloyl-ACP methyl ester carboxylesterase
MTKDIILVHGAFHTGACWDLVTAPLAERGVTAHAITLSGHRGTGRFPSEVTLTDYGDDAIRVAETIGRPCLLLGHSMGGKVVSAAGERRPELFSGIIFLTAFVTRYGKSEATTPPTLTPRMAEALAAGLEHLPDGSVLFPEAHANEVFYNTCSPEMQTFAHARLSPQPLAAMYEHFETSKARLGSVPKHYIECLQDNAVPIEGQRMQQTLVEFRSVHTLDTDHSPFYCAPVELADAIAAIAADA